MSQPAAPEATTEKPARAHRNPMDRAKPPDPPKRTRGRPRKDVAAALPPFDLDVILSLVREGELLADIAKRFLRTRDSLSSWLDADEERRGQVDEARRRSAHAYAEKAEAVLAKLSPKATKTTVARARELAHHYRWMASKMMPKTYGEKVELGGHVQVDPLTVLVQQIQTTGSRVPLRGIDPGPVVDVQPRQLPPPEPAR